MNYDYYITVSSWEERSFLSAKQTCSEHSIKNALIFYTKEYEENTEENTNKLISLFDDCKILYKKVIFSNLNQLTSWKVLDKEISTVKNSTVLFDISTMPRDVIWYFLHFFNQYNCDVSIIYSKPTYYGGWLSKDAGKPRLIYNHSGITNLDNPTALLIVTGFDLERASQLIQYFEPKITFLALQKGEQFDNHKKNIEIHLENIRTYCEVDHFFFDSFTKDGGYEELRNRMSTEVGQYNIVSSSLGPKPSTVALYKLQKDYPQIALCYVPSSQYNVINYSNGLSSTLDIA